MLLLDLMYHLLKGGSKQVDNLLNNYYSLIIIAETFAVYTHFIKFHRQGFFN